MKKTVTRIKLFLAVLTILSFGTGCNSFRPPNAAQGPGFGTKKQVKKYEAYGRKNSLIKFKN